MNRARSLASVGAAGWRARVLLVGLVSMAILALAWPGHASAQDRSTELRDLAVTAEQLSSNGVRFTKTIDGALDVHAATDARMVQEERIEENLVGGWTRDFVSSDGVEVEARLIEFTNNYWASDMRSKGNAEVGEGYPPGARVWVKAPDDPDAEWATMWASAVKGRIQVIAYAREPKDGGHLDRAVAEPLVRHLLATQIDVLPDLPDLTASRNVDLSDLRVLLFAIPVGLVPIAALLGGLGANLHDRGSVEHLAAGGSPRLLAPATVVVWDLSEQVRRLRRSSRLRVVVVVVCATALVALAELIQFITRPPVLVNIAIAPILVALVAVIDIAIRARNDAQPAFGRQPLLPAAIGIGGSIFFVYGGFFFILSAIAAWVLDVRPVERLLLTLVFAALGVVVLRKAMQPFVYARRIAAQHADDALAGDKRRQVLLLRSFQDDELRMRMHRSARHSPVEVVAGEPFERFEELLAWSLWRIGPVVAIGQPGEDLPTLGAARAYFPGDDDTWKQAVRSHSRHSSLIVFIVGRSPGLAWEYRNVCREGALAKCLFVFPPVEAGELGQRVMVLASSLQLGPHTLPPLSPDGPYPIGLMFDEHGTPIWQFVDGRDDLAYRALFDSAAEEIATRQVLMLTGPGPAFRGADVDVADLLAGPDEPRTISTRVSAWTALRGIAVRRVGRRDGSPRDTVDDVGAARARFHEVVRAGRYDTIFDEYLPAAIRADIVNGQGKAAWAAEMLEEHTRRDHSGPETVYVTAIGSRATVYAIRFDGTAAPPMNFRHCDGDWTIDWGEFERASLIERVLPPWLRDHWQVWVAIGTSVGLAWAQYRGLL